jgi:predicted RecA/RadA family phage recombinase
MTKRWNALLVEDAHEGYWEDGQAFRSGETVQLGDLVAVCVHDGIEFGPVCGMRLGAVDITFTALTEGAENSVQVLVNGIWYALGDVSTCLESPPTSC